MRQQVFFVLVSKPSARCRFRGVVTGNANNPLNPFINVASLILDVWLDKANLRRWVRAAVPARRREDVRLCPLLCALATPTRMRDSVPPK